MNSTTLRLLPVSYLQITTVSLVLSTIQYLTVFVFYNIHHYNDIFCFHDDFGSGSLVLTTYFSGISRSFNSGHLIVSNSWETMRTSTKP